MLGSPILYLKGMGILMFQLSGFYCINTSVFQRSTKMEGAGYDFKAACQSKLNPNAAYHYLYLQHRRYPTP